MTCMVHDRKNTHIPLNQDGGSVHVVPRKLDLDQISMPHTHTEDTNVIKLSFRLQISIWMFLVRSVIRIRLKMPQEFPTASLDITLRSSASAAVSA